jgi:histidinol phosphatase-like enzyme
VPIWQFFEIQSGVVGRIKDEIKLLNRVQKVLKLEQELEVHEPLPNATALFTRTGNLNLDEIEKDFKIKVKEAKKLAAKAAKAEAKAQAKAVKALAAAQDKAAAKAKKLALKAGIQAAKKGAKRVARTEKKLAATQAKAAKKLASEQAKVAKALAATEAKAAKAAKKLENKLAKKTIALIKWARANDLFEEDIVYMIGQQYDNLAARSDSNMVTIIDIA